MSKLNDLINLTKDVYFDGYHKGISGKAQTEEEKERYAKLVKNEIERILKG